MKFNLNFQFKSLSGKEFDKLNAQNEVNDLHHAARCLASCLWTAAEKNIKFAMWAQELYKNNTLEIDAADFDLLIAWIEIYGTEPNKAFVQWFSQIGIKNQITESLKMQKEKIHYKEKLEKK